MLLAGVFNGFEVGEIMLECLSCERKGDVWDNWHCEACGNDLVETRGVLFNLVNQRLEIITVGNGSNEYFGNFTKKENKIILENSTGKILNLFSGKSKIGHVRVDFEYGNCTMDVFDYLNNIIEMTNYFDTIIIDAPYNKKFGNKYQKIGNTPKQFIIFADTKKTIILWDKIIELNPKIIILKSWNYYIPKGYILEKGYLCYAGGYRKSTLLLILHKI